MIYNHDASLRDRATLAPPQAPAGLGHPESIPSADFTAEDFLAWARTRPADEAYDYCSITGCALCHYFIDRGIGFLGVGGESWRPLNWLEAGFRDIPEPVAEALMRHPRDYGSLAKRLEKELAK